MNSIEDSSRGRLLISFSVLFLTFTIATLSISSPTSAAGGSVPPQASSSTSTSSSTTATSTTTTSTTTTSSRGSTALLSVSTVDREGDPVSGYTIQALVDTST